MPTGGNSSQPRLTGAPQKLVRYSRKVYTFRQAPSGPLRGLTTESGGERLTALPRATIPKVMYYRLNRGSAGDQGQKAAGDHDGQGDGVMSLGRLDCPEPREDNSADARSLQSTSSYTSSDVVYAASQVFVRR
jgi:hypothetical protein